MKGLLIKDYYFIFKQIKQSRIFMFFSVVFTFVVAVFSLKTLHFLMVYYFGIALFLISAISTLTDDQFNKWNIYCDTLPVSRKTFVTEKYIFIWGNTVILWLISVLLICLSNIIYKVSISRVINTLQFNLMVFMVLLLIPCIIFPLNFKFGYNKTKILMRLMSGIYSGSLTMLELYIRDEQSNEKFIIPDLSFTLFIFVILYVISWFISTEVYAKREL